MFEARKRNMKMIEGTIKIIQTIQTNIDDGSLTLSYEEWALLDGHLDDVRPMLENDRVRMADLEEAAELIVTAIEENKRLKRLFASEIDALLGGTIPTSQSQLPPTTRSIRIIRNKMIKWTKNVKEQKRTTEKEKSK